MKKEDLKVGYLVETRDGKKYMVMPNKIGNLLLAENKNYFYTKHVKNDLTCVDKRNENLDIMKVWGHSCFATRVFEFDTDSRELLWERKEKPKPKLTDNERAILESLEKKWEWISRYKEIGLWIYTNNPWNETFANFNAFNHLFQFVKWEDDEPYNIKELLRG